MLINCAISMYETKQILSDPAPGVGTLSFDFFIVWYLFTMCEWDSCGISL